MKILRDPLAGFCGGVRRAVRETSRLLDRHRRLHIWGALIHNRHIGRIFGIRGLVSHPEDNELPAGEAVVLRTHGTRIDALRKLKTTSSRLYNLCCGKVARVQGIIKRYASEKYHIIIAGYVSHPEVISLASYTSEYTVIKSAKELSTVPQKHSYLLVSQTTFDADTFKDIRKEALRRFGGKLTVEETICDATWKRQKSVTDLVQNATALVVAGGRDSSNTRRLADIGRRAGIKTFHIEDASELCYSDFNDDDTVVLTAGASTPDFITEEIHSRLRMFACRKRGVLPFLGVWVKDVLLKSPLYIALPAAALMYLAGWDPGTALMTLLAIVLSVSLFQLTRSWYKAAENRSTLAVLLATGAANAAFHAIVRHTPLSGYESITAAAVIAGAALLYALSVSFLNRRYLGSILSYEAAVTLPVLGAPFLYETMTGLDASPDLAAPAVLVFCTVYFDRYINRDDYLYGIVRYAFPGKSRTRRTAEYVLVIMSAVLCTVFVPSSLFAAVPAVVLLAVMYIRHAVPSAILAATSLALTVFLGLAGTIGHVLLKP
ncbi:MAG: 4-hydroxy-3-methylbut-2-enyl diphosphate reductase [Spirochaetota bacterium]